MQDVSGGVWGEAYKIVSLVALSLVLLAFIMDTPADLLRGLYAIIIEPDILITDYMGVGGLGATLFNAGLLMAVAILILLYNGIKMNGVSIACLFLMAGFGMFGKNIFNVWFIIIGVYIYAKIQKDRFAKYIYMALFGTCLSPLVTQIMFGTGLSQPLGLILGAVVGISVGIILPPLSTYLMRVHQGFNLYNIGFVAGIIGTIFVSIFRSYGFLPETRLIWTKEYSNIMAIYLLVMFTCFILIGLIKKPKSYKQMKRITAYSGRAISDFVLMEGYEATLINMGINGFIGIGYIYLVGGELNGPTIGGIFTLVGFGAFGKHYKNMLPVIFGVVLGSFTKLWALNDPSIQLAALFGTTLAPIAGEFGWQYGILAGFIHSSVVLNVGVLHGGLNLYNNGFSGGLVAATLIPIIEAFKKEG